MFKGFIIVDITTFRRLAVSVFRYNRKLRGRGDTQYVGLLTYDNGLRVKIINAILIVLRLFNGAASI